MACDLIMKAMAEYAVCEETPEGARLRTHCLYPSFEPVFIYVVRQHSVYMVHDDKGAFHSGWSHGRDERSVARAIEKEAARYRLAVTPDHRIYLSNVSPEWLPSAVLAVANASAAAANAVAARVVAMAEGLLVEKIGKSLASVVPEKMIARDHAVRGRSGGERNFDYAIKGDEGIQFLISGVTSHHTSYSTKYVAFDDVELDLEHKLAVRDDVLKSDVAFLMQRVAKVLPLTALLASGMGLAPNTALH